MNTIIQKSSYSLEKFIEKQTIKINLPYRNLLQLNPRHLQLKSYHLHLNQPEITNIDKISNKVYKYHFIK